ncbi:kinase-like protein [Polychaeton citri CBS 116435]|uniref:Kinase-like protein n=1 Tax=Polychaeton citri CBS 116435 TaxID=1314669 RepID=A0A9P4UQ72_9PEZI|nr:kinase-like protein [Polychaeton citri CBS 116435]
MVQIPPREIDLLLQASKKDFDVPNSTYFQVSGRELPDPSTVDVKGIQDVAIFPEQQLAVKYGREVTVDEAIAMWTVRKLLVDKLPVPELYGWRIRDRNVLIYMELIPGVTLERRWDEADFGEVGKAAVCKELNGMLTLLHQLRQEPSDAFIGSIPGGPLLDRVFEERPTAGPFRTLEKFYSWMEWLPQRFLQASQRYRDPFLELMPKDSSIVFTHADVHPRNIMVTASGPPRVLAIIDWGQSGWYPDWWEHFKMCYTTHYEGDWRMNWIPKIVRDREDERYLMSEYAMTIGAV